MRLSLGCCVPSAVSMCAYLSCQQPRVRHTECRQYEQNKEQKNIRGRRGMSLAGALETPVASFDPRGPASFYKFRAQPQRRVVFSVAEHAAGTSMSFQACLKPRGMLSKSLVSPSAPKLHKLCAACACVCLPAVCVLA